MAERASTRLEFRIRHDAVTIVPAEFFDRLLSALEEEPQPSPALARAGKRARRALTRKRDL